MLSNDQGPFHLVCDTPATIEKQQAYDQAFARLPSDVQWQDATITISPLSETNETPSAAGNVYAVLFWIVLIAVVGLLAMMAWRLLRSMKNPRT